MNDDEKIIKRMSSKNFPIACGIMYKKKELLKYGFYNKNFRHREEEELRARLGKKYNIAYLEIPLYRYRLHNSNKTRSKEYLITYKDKIDRIIQTHILKNKKKIKKNIIAIIPARGGSKRLKNKNSLIVNGKPMIAWTIKSALNSKFINEVYVSSEDKKILKIAKKYNAKIIERPNNLAMDNVPKIEAIKHAVNKINKNKQIDIVVSLQANSPNLKPSEIDFCISDLINKNKREVLSVDKNLNQNGAIRVMKKFILYDNNLSTHFSCRVNNAIDIHTKNDLKKIIW